MTITTFRTTLLIFTLLWFQQADCIKISVPPLTPPETYTSYILGPVCNPRGEIHSPTKTHEVVKLVRFAISQKLEVKAFGSRHSITDIICTNGIAIDMGQFKETLHLNPDHTVTVSAGYTLEELGQFLHEKGRSLQGGPAYGGITIGGALGTGAHGSSLNHKVTLSDQTIALKIIDGNGEIRIITSEEELIAYRVNLAMLGIILTVTLETVPDFKIMGTNYEVPDDILSDGKWLSLARSSDYVSLYWYPNSKTVVVAQQTIVSASHHGHAWTNVILNTSPVYNAGARLTYETLQAKKFQPGLVVLENLSRKYLTGLDPGRKPYYTEDGETFVNPATGYRHRMQENVCEEECIWNHYPHNTTFLDNSIAVDLKDFEKVVRKIKHILKESKSAFQLCGILFRFAKASDSLMATNFGRETVFVETMMIQRKNIYETASAGLAAYQAIQQAMAFTFHGRSHWGKSGFFYHSRSMLQRKLPSANHHSFLSIMHRADPHQIYMNDFGRRLLDESDKMNSDPATTHCALLDGCICSSKTDCAVGQTCSHLPSFREYSVCNNLVSEAVNHFSSHLDGPFSNALDYFKSVIFFSSIRQLED